MRNCSFILLCVVCIVAFASCTNDKQTTIRVSGVASEVKYAKGFLLINHEGYREIIIRDPIDTGRIIETYYLVKKANPVPPAIEGKNIIRVPIESIACLSTTHLGFLEKLDVRNSIVGIAGTQYVYDSLLNQLIEEGSIVEIGIESLLNYELLAQLKPDVFMTYVFGADGEASITKLRSLKLQPVINNEYMELTPLGQAEWIKFVAAFYELSDEAETIFTDVENAYLKTKERAVAANNITIVLTGLPFRGEWTVPGGKSFAANYIRDAGGVYLWSDNQNTFNVPVSMEQVLLRGKDADCWINIGPVDTKADIAEADEKLTTFKAFQNGKLYNNNNRMSANGGNDYWESGVVNPHLVLNDLLKIFHPWMMEEHEFYYYKKVE